MSLILVLDDREADRELFAAILEHAGHDVTAAGTADEAFDAAKRERPSLIVTDLLMPSTSGYEFVRRLRSDPELNDSNVAFWTAAYVEDEVRELARSCGVSTFLSKPVDPHVLIEKVGKALTEKPAPPTFEKEQFDREQFRLLNDKLFQKANELEAASAERWKLLGELLTSQENERRRIAEDIHDGPVQGLAAAAMWADFLTDKVTTSELVEGMNSLRSSISRAINDLRALMFGLEPVELDRQGLCTALEVRLEQVHRETGLRFALENRMKTPPTGATARLLYRACQEGLMNVQKHSQASNVNVLLDQHRDQFVLQVRDDGGGFQPEEAMRVRPGHLGLPSLRERVEMVGGTLQVESEAGAGSTIEVRLPALAPG